MIVLFVLAIGCVTYRPARAAQAMCDGEAANDASR